MDNYFKITKHKGIEFQLELLGDMPEWIIIELRSMTKQDHPGLRFEISLLKLFTFIIHFYDCRHWNYEENRFYEKGEEIESVYEDSNIKTINIEKIDKAIFK